MTNPICLEPINKKTRWRLRPDAKRAPQPWCWPLPRLAGRDPVALRTVDADHRLGVDIGYSAVDLEALLFVPVYAAQDGLVRVAVETTSGYAVSLDHSGKFSTHYAHLDRMFVTPQTGRRRSRFQFVPAGTVIGYAAKSPVHVRFELWKWTDDRGYVPTDPMPELQSWTIHPAPESFQNLPVATAIENPAHRSAP